MELKPCLGEASGVAMPELLLAEALDFDSALVLGIRVIKGDEDILKVKNKDEGWRDGYMRYCKGAKSDSLDQACVDAHGSSMKYGRNAGI